MRDRSDPQREPCALGWTDCVRVMGKERGLGMRGAVDEVVRQVNSRVFRYDVERELDIGLAGAAVASSIEQLTQSCSSVGTRRAAGC